MKNINYFEPKIKLKPEVYIPAKLFSIKKTLGNSSYRLSSEKFSWLNQNFWKPVGIIIPFKRVNPKSWSCRSAIINDHHLTSINFPRRPATARKKLVSLPRWIDGLKNILNFFIIIFKDFFGSSFHLCCPTTIKSDIIGGSLFEIEFYMNRLGYSDREISGDRCTEGVICINRHCCTERPSILSHRNHVTGACWIHSIQNR